MAAVCPLRLGAINPLDLSDEGLLVDLEDRIEDGADLLAFGGHER